MVCEPKVLVVVEEGAKGGCMPDVLEAAGAQVILANSAPEAETLFWVMGADLVILDVVTPGMRGPELIRKLQAVVGQEQVPIIVASPSANPLDRHAALGAGASACLAKPFTPKQLRDAVRRHIPLAETGSLTPAT